MSDHIHKKNLGQNWLIDKTVIQDIITAADLTRNDTVVEIGPGEGALTKSLLATGSNVIAVEKDRDLIDGLKTKFDQYDNFTLIQADVRDLDLMSLLPKNYKLIANIPYYITGLIIRMFLEAHQQPQEMILLMQREVADRIIATDHKESLLSLSVKVYGQPTKIRNVKAGAFRPIPSVDSAVIRISDISRSRFVDNNVNETRFFTIIRQAFNQKRKTLRKTLSDLVSFPANSQLNSRRPESLPLDEWLEIMNFDQSNPHQ